MTLIALGCLKVGKKLTLELIIGNKGKWLLYKTSYPYIR
jgi:hypothetical protein